MNAHRPPELERIFAEMGRQRFRTIAEAQAWLDRRMREYNAAPQAGLAGHIDGVEIPFADIDTLIRSKQTGRLQDQTDVETLEQLKLLGRPEGGRQEP